MIMGPRAASHIEGCEIVGVSNFIADLRVLFGAVGTAIGMEAKLY
jgi:hypothetical protein